MHMNLSGYASDLTQRYRGISTIHTHALSHNPLRLASPVLSWIVSEPLYLNAPVSLKDQTVGRKDESLQAVATAMQL
jgi:hypothetical protein